MLKVRSERSRTSVRALSAFSFLALVAGLLSTTAAPAGAAYPGVNGKIAFVKAAILLDNEIYTVDPDGTNLTRLTDNSSIDDTEPSWSPNGNKIAFSSDRAGDYDIWTMNADGTSLTHVTDTGGATGDDRDPTWSPNGATIAFEDVAAGVISTVPAVGGAKSPLSTPTGGDGPDTDPSWAPSGNLIAFERPESGSDVEIYTVNAGTGAEAAVTATGVDENEPDWSPNANRIAVEDGSGVINSLNSATGLVTTVLTASSVGPDDNPAFSPNGAFVAYDRNYILSSQIEYVRSDGTGGQQIVVPGSLLVGGFDPNWQPTTAAPVPPPAPGFNRLSVVRSGNGTGTVTSSPAGISCGSDCLEDYANGTSVTLTATPTSDSVLAGWNVAGCTGVTCAVTMSADTTVNPVFNLKPPSAAAASALLDVRCGQPFVICGTNGHDVLVGTSASELILAFAGDDNTNGGGGADVIIDPSGNNIIRGGAGSDELLGGPGRDHMRGGSGNDNLVAKAGNDRLTGGAGFDSCNDGPGNDVVNGCEVT